MLPPQLTFKQRSRKRRGEDITRDDVGNNKTGPIYVKTDGSLTLYRDEDEWSLNNPDGIVPVVVNPSLVNGFDPDKTVPLMPAQVDGLKFLWKCFEEKQGGILAHDMGLGKTRTTVTFVATLLEQTVGSRGKSSPGINKCIIIVPKMAMSVWEEEFMKWCPTSPCLLEIVRPGQKNGWEVINSFKGNTTSKTVLLLTYETFEKHNSNYVDGFCNYPAGSIGLVVCDEAHILKNEKTNRVKSLRKFQTAANLWIGLTGTPYQNNIEELCNLVSFFRKSVFDGERVNAKKVLCEQIMKSLKKYGKLENDLKPALQDLKCLLRPALHFRVNELEIERHDVIICVPLYGHPKHYPLKTDGNQEDVVGPEIKMQHELYKTIAETLMEAPMSFFEKLSYLHKACIHPLYVVQAMEKKPDIFAAALSIYNSAFTEEDRAEDSFYTDFLEYSGKISVVMKMAQHLLENNSEKPEKEKMIIVSNSTKLLAFVEDLFKSLRIETLKYDGEMPEKARERCLFTFDSDDSKQLLLLSLKAGGVALNLTRANHLILMDPDYNPANDRQALARIYRPTQKRPVYIYRLLATGTIEECKYILQLGKEEMEKFIRRDGHVDVQAPFKESELVRYYDQTPSYIWDTLYTVNLENVNCDDDLTDRVFAEEIISSKMYSTGDTPPEKLPLVQCIWPQISFAFHLEKNVDDILESLEN